MAREGRIGWIAARRPPPPRCVSLSRALCWVARALRGVLCRPRRADRLFTQPVASASQVSISVSLRVVCHSSKHHLSLSTFI
jgi:hypothetical protein